MPLNRRMLIDSQITPKNILILEPFREGNWHQSLNASLVMTCHRAYPNATVTFAGYSSHVSSVTELTGQQDWMRILHIDDLIDAENKFRPLGAFSAAKATVGLSNLLQADRIIVSSSTRYLIFVFDLFFSMRVLFERDIVFIIHDGLAQLGGLGFKSWLRSLAGFRGAILLASRRHKFVVLERAILEKLRSRDVRLGSRISFFRHPIYPRQCHEVAIRPSTAVDLIRVGIIGRLTRDKGFSRFLQLAECAHRKYPGKFEFHVIGKLSREIDGSELERYARYLSSGPAHEEIESASYVGLLAELDFAAFLYQGGRYAYTASGTLMDCVRERTPVFFSNNPIVKSIEAEHGEIGLDCDGLNDDEILDRLVRFRGTKRYEVWLANLGTIVDRRSPEGLAIDLRALLD